MGRKFINVLFKASSLIQIEQKDKIAGLMQLAAKCRTRLRIAACMGPSKYYSYPKTNFIFIVMVKNVKSLDQRSKAMSSALVHGRYVPVLAAGSIYWSVSRINVHPALASKLRRIWGSIKTSHKQNVRFTVRSIS